MEHIDNQNILTALRNVKYPGNGKDIVENGMVDDIVLDGNKLSFAIIFDKPTDPFIKSVVRAAETAINTFLSPEIEVKGNVIVKSRKAIHEEPRQLLPGVKNIVAVTSGKGGVGKSTVAANLAVALAARGLKVGILDADIFGPSLPKMFGVEDETIYIVNRDGRDWIEPIERYGVKMLSIGFMVDKNKPVLWRGSMASNYLKQLISDSLWGDLDYLLIDMPPGTSDIHLTLVQTLAVTGVVVVSTPQEVALADARKGIAMFMDKNINVPVLGLVENMAWFTPEEHPDEKYYIFGREGASRLAQQLNVELLAEIPLVMSIRSHSDEGEPVAVVLLNDPAAANEEARAFAHLADRTVKAVARRNSELPPTETVKTK